MLWGLAAGAALPLCIRPLPVCFLVPLGIHKLLPQCSEQQDLTCSGAAALFEQFTCKRFTPQARVHCLRDSCIQGAVEARNRDYAAIVRSLNFVSKGWYDTQIQADEEAEVRRKVCIS